MNQCNLTRNFNRITNKNNRLFDENTANLFTDFIHSKAKFEIDVEAIRKAKPATAINWKRYDNGGHIPFIKDRSKDEYLEMFARRSYIKPNQLEGDANEIENIIDDIKTNPKLTFSRKKQMIDIAIRKQ